MRWGMTISRLLVVWLYLTASMHFLSAQTVAPKILFTDLISGPATGGEAGEGVFVTLYGSGFGESQGGSTVSIGEHPVRAYPIWTDARITVQIGHEARTGAIVVHREGAGVSNGLPFTVRPGHIYFVSTAGRDNGPGSFTRPLRTLVAAKDRLNAGVVAYAMDGVEQINLEKYDSAFSIQTSGKPGLPLALIAYPKAHVTIGTFHSPQIAARTPNIDRVSDHWVLAGLTFRGSQEALDLTASKDWRIIGNDFSCPFGFGPTGCVETTQATNVAFLGNVVHDVARPRTTKMYHAVYFGTDSNHIDVGWNVISQVHGCRGIQFHSTPLDPGTGYNQYDIEIHDNIIHDVVCDAINLATIDPSKGSIKVYNNLIYNAGMGPDPEDGSANYACIYVGGGANAGLPGSGIVAIDHNTLVNCGARGNTDSGALSYSKGSQNLMVRLLDNVIVVGQGVPLLSPNSAPILLHGGDNIFWSGKTVRFNPEQPAFRSLDPLLRDPGHGDFRPRLQSLAGSVGGTSIGATGPILVAGPNAGVGKTPSTSEPHH
jgi:hypothetical protein